MKDLQTVLDALEYHVAQTRPIQSTTEAIEIVRKMMQAEPVAWIVFDEYGIPVHSTVHPKMAQDHINDALQEHDIQEAAKWVVRPVYAAPQAVPAGYVLVPVEPTLEMIDAARNECADYQFETAHEIYKAMLTAAPKGSV